MSYNGSGTFLINSAGQPVVANTVISATVFNALTSDLATGLSTAITKDGQTTITNNIPFGSNKITGLGSGTAAADAANLGQVQSTVAKLITVTGTDTITGSMSPQLTAYAAGQLFYFVANAANTSAVTLNIDSLGAKSITRDGSSALAAGDINSGEVVVVIYDGTRFQMINAANSFGNTTINGTLTVTGNAGFQANVSITSALSVGGVFAVTGAATFTANPTLSGGTANGVLYLNGSKVATSGSALVFDGTNLGIGTASPATRLEVVGASAGSTVATFTSNETGSTTSLAVFQRSGGAVAAAVKYNASNSPLTIDFGTTTNHGLTFLTNNTERMRLDSSGNLGIGTTSPTARVHAYSATTMKQLTVDGVGGIMTGINFANAGTTYGQIFFDNNSPYDMSVMQQYVTGSLRFGTNNTERARITSGGLFQVTADGANQTFTSSGQIALKNSADSPWISWHQSTGARIGYLQMQATGNANLYVEANQPLVFATNNTERCRISAAGNVGIGTSSPQELLSLYKNGNSLMVDIGTNTNSNEVLGGFDWINSYNTNNYNTARIDVYADGATNSAALRFWTASASSTPTERARITSGGNLLVGTTTDFASAKIVTDSGGIGILNKGLLRSTTDGVIQLSADPNNAYATSSIRFDVDGTEYGRFTSGGYFKASNDGTYVSSTGSYHEFRGGLANGYTCIVSSQVASPASQYVFDIRFSAATPNDTNARFWSCTDATAERAYMRSNGGLSNYQANDTNLSDQRVKKDIKPLGSMWDKFKALEIVTFKYTDQTHDDDNIGVIAQQVESVAPEFIDTDGFGKTPEGEEPLKTVYTTDMYHAAIKALQEAMARIEQLEAKVAVLESK